MFKNQKKKNNQKNSKEIRIILNIPSFKIANEEFFLNMSSKLGILKKELEENLGVPIDFQK